MEWTSIIGVALWALIPGFIANNKGRSFWGYYFLSFLITPLISMIVTLFLSRVDSGNTNASILNSEVAAISAAPSVEKQEGTIAASESMANAAGDGESAHKKIAFCRKCGFKLLEGSDFCSNCGAQIEKEEQ